MSCSHSIQSNHIVLGDWGTSSLRLFLLNEVGECVQQINGLGVSRLETSAEEAFFDYIDDWRSQFSIEYCLLSGMVGSNIGWQTVPYMNCPTTSQRIGKHLLQFTSDELDIYLVPGLKCINPLNNPDVMRGEEVQILGLLEKHQKFTQGHHLLCLPGTHTKWVCLFDGVIESFFSAPTGEMYDLLGKHSTLFELQHNLDHKPPDKQFLLGVEQANQAGLLMQLFQVRAKNIFAQIDKQEQQELMSGLLIGHEVVAALDIASKVDNLAWSNIIIVGAKSLAERYQIALNQFGCNSVLMCGEQITLSGLKSISRAIHLEGRHDARK